MLEELLEHWDLENELLVIAGDMVDRGENSFETVSLLYMLKRLYPHNVVILKGNHEEIFLRWLDSPTKYSFHYMRSGGLPTVNSFLNMTKKAKDRSSEELMAEAILHDCNKLIEFLRNLPLYFEHGKYVIVHAGVHLVENEDWKENQDHVMLWIREKFYGENIQNSTEKVFIFGHTPTHDLTEGASTDIWFSNCRTKIGIDGGAVYGGTLNGLKIDIKTGTYTSVQIKHPYLEEYIQED